MDLGSQILVVATRANQKFTRILPVVVAPRLEAGVGTVDFRTLVVACLAAAFVAVAVLAGRRAALLFVPFEDVHGAVGVHAAADFD